MPAVFWSGLSILPLCRPGSGSPAIHLQITYHNRDNIEDKATIMSFDKHRRVIWTLVKCCRIVHQKVFPSFSNAFPAKWYLISMPMFHQLSCVAYSDKLTYMESAHKLILSFGVTHSIVQIDSWTEHQASTPSRFAHSYYIFSLNSKMQATCVHCKLLKSQVAMKLQ